MKATTNIIYCAIALFAVACFALPSAVEALNPPPDGAYPNFTTAEGQNALHSLSTGAANTALGAYSLFSNAAASYNTAVGAGALDLNSGDSNTAVGTAALLLNTIGFENTAIGTAALEFNDTSEQNTAAGAFALFSHTSNGGNTAIGANALFNDVDGELNTAIGSGALFSNVGGPFPGSFNTAVGATALYFNTGGDNNAVGAQALQSNTTGNDNIAIGVSSLAANTSGNANLAFGTFAGLQKNTGSYNIYIGNQMEGVAGESNACYIASIFGQTSANGIPVLINSANKLGTATSSKRFKEDIKPMAKTSEALFSLKPVTFRYKKEIDPAGLRQFGLVAEDVEKVNPDLVVRDQHGKVNSVRYEQINAMLLNEFLKEHRKIEEQRKDFEAALARQQKQIEALTAGLQKVSAELELKKAAPQTVLNNH